MLAYDLYGIKMDPNKFEEIALTAWHKIGNRQTRLFRFSTEIQCPGNYVDLPCNCDIIEAVTYDFEDWNYTTNQTVNGDYASQFIESYIEGRKAFENPLYISGKYAKYERVGDTLYFDKNYGKINILYKGIILDDDALPYINEKEKQAIACFCAYAEKFREGLEKQNANIIQMAEILNQKWLKLCDAARVPVYLNQNDINKILDAKSSWNRKQFNKSYKSVK